MSLGNILGQVMQSGLGGRSPTQTRLQRTSQNLGQSGGGLDGLFRQLEGAVTGRSGSGQRPSGQSSGGLGGLAEMAREFLGKKQAGNMTGAQIGGIGAAAGGLLGGGLGGAARGGALALLGTLAINALRNSQRSSAGASATGDPSLETHQLEPQQDEIDAVTGPDAERLTLRAMISAAKADGQIDQQEMEKIVGRLGGDEVTEEERQFVLNEMRNPVDINSLAAEARHPALAAEVYAASLMAINLDSEQEKQYLRNLADALRLDAETVTSLHRVTGAPPV